MKFAVPSKREPLSTKELAANEAKRDLAAESLQSVREMKAGQVAAALSPVIETRKKTDPSQAQFAGQPVTVNEAIDNLGELAGQDILIEGVLSFSFEDTSLTHWPKAERREGYGSSLWISTGAGSLQFDRQTCQRLSGKRVVIEGTLLQPDPRLGGCGHMSLPDSRHGSAPPGVAHDLSQRRSTMNAPTSGVHHGHEPSPVPTRPFDGGIHAALRK